MALQKLDDDCVQIPMQTLKNSKGFSLDIGYRLTKVVYRSKHDFCNGSPTDHVKASEDMGCAKLAMFPSEDIEEVLAFIKENCDVLQKLDEQAVHVCGQGATPDVVKRVENEFGCQVVLENEIGLMADYATYLFKNENQDQVFYQPHMFGVAIGNKSVEMRESYHTAGNPSTRNTGPKFGERYPERTPTKFPIIIANLGTKFQYIKISDDGSPPEILQTDSMGGEFLHGVCGTFMNFKDGEELLRTAEEHDGQTVEMTFEDLIGTMHQGTEEHESENMYETFTKTVGNFEKNIRRNMRVFIMDKMITTDRESVKLGDGVRSILETVCESAVHNSIHTAFQYGIKQLYFAGSLVHSDLVRMFITKHYALWNSLGEKNIESAILRKGSHLSAIGAFLKSSKP